MSSLLVFPLFFFYIFCYSFFTKSKIIQSSAEVINFSNRIQVTQCHLCYMAVMTNCQLNFEFVTKSCILFEKFAKWKIKAKIYKRPEKWKIIEEKTKKKNSKWRITKRTCTKSSKERNSLCKQTHSEWWEIVYSHNRIHYQLYVPGCGWREKFPTTYIFTDCKYLKSLKSIHHTSSAELFIRLKCIIASFGRKLEGATKISYLWNEWNI